MILRIKEGETIISEMPYSERHEQTLKMDIEAYNVTAETPRTVEVYEDPHVKTLAELKKELKASISAESFKRVNELYPQYQQVNAALGIYDAEKTETITSTIQLHRMAVHAMFEDIDSKTKKTDLENYQRGWP